MRYFVRAVAVVVALWCALSSVQTVRAARWGLASVNPGARHFTPVAVCDQHVVLFGGLGGDENIINNDLFLVRRPSTCAVS